MSKRWRGILAAILCLLYVLPAHADDIIKVTQLDAAKFPEMTVYVSVTDETGRPVAALQREDFQLFEDSHPVAITDFAGVGEARPVDIVFVFDTTSSMGEEIEGVKETAIAFAEELRASNRDFRLGLVTFGDDIRLIRNPDNSLTANAEEFKGWISELVADGGDDTPELALDALEQATKMSYRENTQKVLLLITDAPPHIQGDGTPFSAVVPTEQVARLRDNSFTVYAVAHNDPHYRDLVNATSGEFYELYADSDFTGIIEKIGGLIASQYRMSYISARPSPDGTRRTLEVKVGETVAAEEYLEQHLVNIHSTPTIALLLFIPLLLALVLPSALTRARAARPTKDTPPAAAQRPPQPQAAVAQDVRPMAHTSDSPSSSCPQCGNPLRSNAKFCGRCGQVLSPPAATVVIAPSCPHCHNPLKPGARFCGKCGQAVAG